MGIKNFVNGVKLTNFAAKYKHFAVESVHILPQLLNKVQMSFFLNWVKNIQIFF